MDAQLAQKVSQLAHALKASGGASDNKEAYDMAIEILKKKEAASVNTNTNNNTEVNAVTINSGTNNNSRTTTIRNTYDSNIRTDANSNNGVFLGKDSVGFELKGKTLKELAAEDAAKKQP